MRDLKIWRIELYCLIYVKSGFEKIGQRIIWRILNEKLSEIMKYTNPQTQETQWIPNKWEEIYTKTWYRGTTDQKRQREDLWSKGEAMDYLKRMITWY